jgi:hypothetical protein
MNYNIKLFVALLSLVAFSISAQAQLYIGPRAGINLASLATNQAGYESNSKMGLNGGLTVRYQFMKQLSVQADALYSQMGGENVLETTTGNVVTKSATKYYYDYAQVPLYVNFELPLRAKTLVPYRVKTSFASIHLYAGGFFGYGIGSQAATTTTVSNNDGTGAVVTAGGKGDLADGTFNAIDFGAMGGVGVSFKLDDQNKQRVGMDARYILGLGNTSNVKAVTETNSAIQACVTYSVKLTKRNIRY